MTAFAWIIRSTGMCCATPGCATFRLEPRCTAQKRFVSFYGSCLKRGSPCPPNPTAPARPIWQGSHHEPEPSAPTNQIRPGRNSGQVGGCESTTRGTAPAAHALRCDRGAATGRGQCSPAQSGWKIAYPSQSRRRRTGGFLVGSDRASEGRRPIPGDGSAETIADGLRFELSTGKNPIRWFAPFSW
jgi:hypothetical protein